MAKPDTRVPDLLAQINGGEAPAALLELDRLLHRQPTDPALLTLRAEALRVSGRAGEAIEAFQ